MKTPPPVDHLTFDLLEYGCRASGPQFILLASNVDLLYIFLFTIIKII